MKAKVALLLVILFVASVVTFGKGHERHERKFQKSEFRCDNKKQNDSRDYKFDRNHKRFGQEKFGHKDSPMFNKKRFDRNSKHMIKRHNLKNKELSYFMNNSILLPEVTVYAEKI